MPPIVHALVPVIVLITCGYLAGRLQWVGEQGLKDIAKLAFNLLAPALLFRTLSQVHLSELDLAPVILYHSLTALWLTVWVAVFGFTHRGCIRALGATYSNAVMIGIPLVSLAYGPAGLVYMLTLVSLHALTILTYATILFELAAAREARQQHIGGQAHESLWVTGIRAAQSALMHPVSLPSFLGLIFAQTGWALPELIDKPMEWLGRAFSPLALIMVGIQLQHVLSKGLPWGRQSGTAPRLDLKPVIQMVALKNLCHPLLILIAACVMGIGDMPLTVMLVTACMPVGANVFLFATRYKVGEAEVSLSLSLSVMAALFTVPAMMALQPWVVQSLRP